MTEEEILRVERIIAAAEEFGHHIHDGPPVSINAEMYVRAKDIPNILRRISRLPEVFQGETKEAQSDGK